MKKGYLDIALATFFFSTMEIALKVISGVFNPVQLTFIRFFIGSLILLPLAIRSLRKRNISIRLKDFLFFSYTGLICVVISMTFYQLAIVYSQASVVAVLFSCNPVFVVLFAFLMLREPIYKHTVLSIVVSVLGILFIMNPLHSSGNFLGIAFTVLAAVTFAFYGVAGKKKSAEYGGIVLSCLSFLMGSMEMLALIFVTRIGPVASFMRARGLAEFADIPVFHGLAPGNLLIVAYIGIFVTGLGYTFYFLAMEKTSAATASLVFFIKPALAPVLALLLIHEPISLNMLFGILFIIAGSLISFIPGIRLRRADGVEKGLKEDVEEIVGEIKAETEEVSFRP